MATENYLRAVNWLLYIDTTTSVLDDSVDIPGDFKAVGCLTNVGLDTSVASTDITNKCTGGFADSTPTTFSFSFSAEGQAIKTSTGDARFNHNKLLKLAKNKTAFWLALFNADDLTTVRTSVVFISAYAESAGLEQYGFTATFTGKGDLLDQEDLVTSGGIAAV